VALRWDDIDFTTGKLHVRRSKGGLTSVHPCGYKLANDGQDTRAIQHYLGHMSIASTVRYTALAPDRFKNFWKD
jgi:integrase